ncbi:NADPH:quinone oxidoreductase family protein [uncultured Pseudosulfitobacter sp.]|uniref:NADPH:quinone oxidoreductase family protein n=1 Tax=uncultured Pseudosulfitobacter sp. TaxID=2854214 RepID=UPI0030DD13C8|tara:strand:- start:5776 stop:6771 length:996 start_codon:yes stop_codon:yes gene_type:complete
MKAMMSTAVGGPETLEWTETADPKPAKGEVRIAVKAAGVNFPDTLIIQDLYQMKPERPFAPGGEVSGVVEELGEGVTGFAVGDKVIAMTGFGGFATQLCAPAAACLKMPDDMSFEDAACLVLTYGTSHHALKDRANIQPGETLFILGAAGGVGVAAIELGKAAGARVIAAVSSEEKAAFCREVGADETLVYTRDMDKDAQRAFSKEIKDLVGPKGIDVAYDAVGGNYAEPVIRAMAWAGRFLVVGFPAGIPKIPLNLTLLKSCQIVGVFWGASTRQDPKGHMENMQDLFTLYSAGKIKPRIDTVFPLQEAGKALEYIQDRKVQGKVVLKVE